MKISNIDGILSFFIWCWKGIGKVWRKVFENVWEPCVPSASIYTKFWAANL